MKSFNLILSLLLLFSIKLSAQVSKPIPEDDSVYSIVEFAAEPLNGNKVVLEVSQKIQLAHAT